jgi:hypothetical protein
MIRRLAITLLAVIIVAFRLGRRRKQVSAREIVESRLSVIAERIREGGGLAPKGAEPEVQDGDPGPAVRDAQAAWLWDQELITTDSVITVVQGVRATITHAGAVEARALLDDLQQQAANHPEGVPGYLVAAGRVRFDELMRRNIQ